MNQPTVRDRSTSAKISSRPCPSRSSSTALPAAPPTPPAPLRNRQHQAGQQHIVDAAMEGRRHSRQQRPRDRSRQREREMAGRADDVPIRIERAVNQRQQPARSASRSRTQAPPAPRRILRLAASRCAQRTQRGAARPQRRRPAARNRLPGRRKIRHQDAPRHPVHRKMMDHQQQPPRLPRSGIEPHRLQHHAGRRRKPRSGASRLLRRCRRAAPPHRARKHRPAAGRSPPAPRQAAQSPGPSRRSSAAATSAAATHRDDRAPPAGPQSDDPRCRPAGTCSSIAWLKRSIGPPRSSSQRMIGVGGNAPMAMSGRSEAVSCEQAGNRQPAPPRSDAGTPRAA